MNCKMQRYLAWLTALLFLAITAVLIGGAGATSNPQCTVQTFTQQARECVNQFADTFRRAPAANCTSVYNQAKTCVNHKLSECLTSQLDSRTSRFISHTARLYVANEAFYCNDGTLMTLVNFTPARLSTCSAKFFKKAAQCRSIFLRKFRSSRGNRTLCRRYSRAKQCMYRSLSKFCKPTRLIHSLMAGYQQKYNPYCRKTRLDPGSGKARTNPFGRCSAHGYVIKSRACIAHFFRELQQNNGRNCRSTVTDILLPCIKRTKKRCLRGTRSEEKLESQLNALFTRIQVSVQNRFCEGGYLETMRLKANQCSEEYFETLQGRCNNQFIAKYRQNRADPSLCWEYADVKKCARNMTLTHCKLEKNQIQEMNFIYGNFNPFCTDAKDPGKNGGRRGKQTTSNGKSSGVTHGYSLLLLTACIAGLAMGFIY